MLSSISIMYVVAIIAISLVLIPTITISYGVDFFWSADPSEYPLTKTLQTSLYLVVTHVSCLTSLLALALDILMDIFSKNSTISLAIRLKERCLIFLALTLTSVVYLSCRSSAFISIFYVVAHYSRSIILTASIYSSVYSELEGKKDAWLTRGITFACALWIFASVLHSYAMFVDFTWLPQISGALNFISYCVLVATIIRWIYLVAIRQRLGTNEFFQLTVDEYNCFVYLVPMIVYIPAGYAWTIIGKDYSWDVHTEQNCIYIICVHIAFGLYVITVPGRIIRILASINIELLNLKQTFVRHLSHEIRSPLNVVHAGLDILRSDINLDDPSTMVLTRDKVELIEQIFSASGSSIDLLNDLLIYEHIDSGAFSLDLSWHPMPTFLAGKFAWAKILAEQKALKLIIQDNPLASHGLEDVASGGDVEESLPALLPAHGTYLQVDTYKIEQVIRNLITNAVKFTPADGTVVVSASCELLSDENQNRIISKVGANAVGVLRVQVQDTGAGIAAENQEKVFGEFNQFNRNELQGGGGSGLGLWISRRIIHMHQGYLGFESRGQGLGSTFFFELPIYSAATAGVDLTSAPPQLFSPWRENRIIPAGDSVPVTLVSAVESESATLGTNIPGELGGFFVGQVSTRSEIQPQSTRSYLSDFLEVVSLETSPRIHPENQEYSQLCGCSHSPDNITIPPVDSRHSTTRFLIVDDSALNRKILVRIISGEKVGRYSAVEFIEADDGETAVEALRSEMAAGRSVDFVLMDFVMIRMHGPAAAMIMRKELLYSGPMIGVTGNTLPDDISKFLEAGVNEVVIKPLTKAKLLGALARY